MKDQVSIQNNSYGKSNPKDADSIAVSSQPSSTNNMKSTKARIIEGLRNGGNIIVGLSSEHIDHRPPAKRVEPFISSKG